MESRPHEPMFQVSAVSQPWGSAHPAHTAAWTTASAAELPSLHSVQASGTWPGLLSLAVKVLVPSRFAREEKESRICWCHPVLSSHSSTCLLFFGHRLGSLTLIFLLPISLCLSIPSLTPTSLPIKSHPVESNSFMNPAKQDASLSSNS